MIKGLQPLTVVAKYPAKIYLFKVNNRNIRTLETYFASFSSVSIVDFEQVNVS